MFLFGCTLSFAGVVFLTSDKGKLGNEATSLHLDMMPNFIRSLAPSFKTLNVQPQASSSQVLGFVVSVEARKGVDCRTVMNQTRC